MEKNIYKVYFIFRVLYQTINQWIVLSRVEITIEPSKYKLSISIIDTILIIISIHFNSKNILIY